MNVKQRTGRELPAGALYHAATWAAVEKEAQ